jgi:DNA polymerase epsilon subunit 1
VKIYFHNTQDLQNVRRELLPLANTNSAKLNAIDAYAEVVSADAQGNGFGAAMEIGYGQDDEYENAGESSRSGARAAWGAESTGVGKGKGKDRDPQDCIVDLREHDIAYYLRVAIDLGASIGSFTLVQTRTVSDDGSCFH